MPVIPASNPEHLDVLAVSLVQQSGALSRVVFARLGQQLSRSEAAVLARLEAGPERITALAERDGLAQPTMTILVKRLEEMGLVRRARSRDDGRVVLVSLTAQGSDALASVRASYRALLSTSLAELPAEEIAVLDAAVDVISSLVERLQREGSR